MSIVCYFVFYIVPSACRGEEKPIVQKNSVCLLCGNAGNAYWTKTQTTEVFIRLKITFWMPCEASEL